MYNGAAMEITIQFSQEELKKIKTQQEDFLKNTPINVRAFIPDEEIKKLFRTIPSVNAIVVTDKEQATRLAALIPDSMVVEKIQNHINKNSNSNLARTISSAVRGNY